jgi:hypothetical protein
MYDWFSDTPAREMIPDVTYQLVVTLGAKMPRPWDRFEGVFHEHLKRIRLELVQDQVTVYDAPLYMTKLLSQVMGRFDQVYIEREGVVPD